MPLRFLTAGESHGPQLNAIIEGLPAGLQLLPNDINLHLARRQKGYGRGGRMQIEKDKVTITSGVRHGKTIASPVTLTVTNRDWQNWLEVMSVSPVDKEAAEVKQKLDEKKIEFVRPGHADLSGALKYDHDDIRNVLERSSARETAARVAVGAVALKLLQTFDIDVFSHVQAIGTTKGDMNAVPEDMNEAKMLANESPVSCIDKSLEQEMIKEIDSAQEKGDTLGGIIQVIATGLPVGLGSYVHWDKRLDAMIAHAIMSIPAVKSVGIGIGETVGMIPGSLVHDEILPKDNSNEFQRATNRAGGIEGGMTNGQAVVVRVAMKPIPTLKQPLRSVNLETGEEHVAHYERSDVCAVPACGVVCEAMLSYVLANAFLDKFGGDSIKEISRNYSAYKQQYQNR